MSGCRRGRLCMKPLSLTALAADVGYGEESILTRSMFYALP